MKRVLTIMLVGSFLMFTAGSALAAASQSQRNTGCGLGTLLFGAQSDGSVMSQSFQATTNGLFGNQTFGITSGTLGCEQPASIIKNDKALAFAADNMDTLARDIAAGQGESLDTLAELLAIPAPQRVAAYGTLQQNFDRIFVTGDETAGVVLDRIAVLTL